jgi:hypothetical protein
VIVPSSVAKRTLAGALRPFSEITKSEVVLRTLPVVAVVPVAPGVRDLDGASVGVAAGVVDGGQPGAVG